MTPTEQRALTAARATEGLVQAVSMKWFDAAPRVRHWQDTIEMAYIHYLAGDHSTPVDFPDDATTQDGLTYDSAINVLDAFDNWLGRNVVFEALDWALDQESEVE